LYGDCIIETGEGGSVEIGDESHIQPGCRIMGYVGSTRIGKRVEMAPNCACYPYNHGIAPGRPIRSQPLQTKSGIQIGDDAWLGFGVIVLDGVRIGDGAVIGAGAVVTRDVPAGAIAAGNPARIIGMRGEQAAIQPERCLDLEEPQTDQWQQGSAR
jgi:acetyltransferase-like isoleucine patch superfamily enzyme